MGNSIQFRFRAAATSSLWLGIWMAGHAGWASEERTLAACGNGVLDPQEACDDGNTQSGDGCSATCTVEALCGNGVTDPVFGEECDDSNNQSGDGCSAFCTLEVCGNGLRDPAEQCDDGNTQSGDGCSATCTVEGGLCGNALLNAGEQCDDGNTQSGDGCSATCVVTASCGNGIVEPVSGEECDDRNTQSGDGCDATCRFEAVCGNGTVEPVSGEECDDSNTLSGDGCSPVCTVEQCGNAVLNPGEACDDGNAQSGDGCSATCTVEALCGNGVTDPVFGEECDDSNNQSGDGCSAFCTLEVCGNGLRDPAEQCDDGNTVSGDGCSNICTVEGVAPGRVPATIRLSKTADPAVITISWSASCSAPAEDYAIYKGVLGAWYSHTSVDCHDDSGNLQEDLPMPGGNTYYLVVPYNLNGAEGSYGSSSFSSERPVGISRCAAVQDVTCP